MPPNSNSTMIIPQTRLFYQNEVIKNYLAEDPGAHQIFNFAHKTSFNRRVGKHLR
jgi:hypothetical protein